jgi:integrase
MPATHRAARTRRQPPAYCRHKASGLAYVKIHGRRHYLGAHGTDEAWQRYQQKITELWARPTPSPQLGLTLAQVDRLTIIDLLFAYWKHAEQHYRKHGQPTGTLANIKPALRRMREQLGEQLAAMFGPLKLKALRQSWIDDRLALKTVNEYTAAVKRVFFWGVENELVPPGVAHGLKTVRHLAKGRSLARETAPVPPVDDDVVDATLPCLPPIVADMVRFQRLTGARPGEICGMRPCDVQRYAERRGKRGGQNLPLFPGEPATQPLDEDDVWEYHPATHKMEHRGRPRVVLIGPEAQKILRTYLLRPVGKPAATATETTCFGYTTQSYRKAVTRGCERAFKMPEQLRKANWVLKRRKLTPEQKAGLQNEANAWRAAHCWHPHQLRHTAATAINARYGDEDAARVVLGHATKTTTQIYAQRDLAKAKAIAREVG